MAITKPVALNQTKKGDTMEALRRKILSEGRVASDDVLKVDSFLNHQLDTVLLNQIAEEFYQRFASEQVTKIVTVEASGIALAVLTGRLFEVPVIFAKKQPQQKASDCQSETFYTADVYSYTKACQYQMVIAKDYLQATDCVLLIDDFLANGEAATGLMTILEQAGAKLVGLGIAIEKGFQKGGDQLRRSGIKVESLAIIDRMTKEGIVFREND